MLKGRASVVTALLLVTSFSSFAKTTQFGAEVNASLDADINEIVVFLFENKNNAHKMSLQLRQEMPAVCEENERLNKPDADVLAASSEQQKQYLKCWVYQLVSPAPAMFTYNRNTAASTIRSMVEQKVGKVLKAQARNQQGKVTKAEVEQAEALATERLNALSIDAFIKIIPSEFVAEGKTNPAKTGRGYAWQHTFKARKQEVLAHFTNEVGVNNFGDYFENACSNRDYFNHKDVCELIKRTYKEHRHKELSEETAGMNNDAYFKKFAICTETGSGGILECDYYLKQQDNKSRMSTYIAELVANQSLEQLTENLEQYCQQKNLVCHAYQQATKQKRESQSAETWKDDYNRCQEQISSLMKTDRNAAQLIVRSEECRSALRGAIKHSRIPRMHLQKWAVQIE
ncbi:MAG: hypothetical protein ACPF9E_00260 [Alteromonas oceani]